MIKWFIVTSQSNPLCDDLTTLKYVQSHPLMPVLKAGLNGHHLNGTPICVIQIQVQGFTFQPALIGRASQCSIFYRCLPYHTFTVLFIFTWQRGTTPVCQRHWSSSLDHPKKKNIWDYSHCAAVEIMGGAIVFLPLLHSLIEGVQCGFLLLLLVVKLCCRIVF